MCGIVGYIGRREAAPIIVEGLKKLEYRGYDSFGVATISSGIELDKHQGRISDSSSSAINLKGKIGIGHTRWATHGVPNDVNAHPHLDCSNQIAVVHNGIIENYAESKAQLMYEVIYSALKPIPKLWHILSKRCMKKKKSPCSCPEDRSKTDWILCTVW